MATGTQALWADSYLKKYYPWPGRAWTAVNHRTPGLDLLESGSNMPTLPGGGEGQQVILLETIKTNPNAAIGLGESKGMPTGSVSEGLQITYNMAAHYQRCTMSARLMEVSDGFDRSVIGLKQELKLQRTAFRNKLGWLIHGDGSGEIGQASTGTSAGVLTMQAYVDLTILFKDAECILRHRTTGALFSGLTSGVGYRVTAKSNSKGTAPTVTLVSASTGASPDLSAIDSNYGLYFYDSQGASIIGLGMSCSASNPSNWGSATSFYGGIDRSDTDNAFWAAYELDASSKNIDIRNHVQRILDNLNQLAGDDVDSDQNDGLLGFTGYDSYRSIGNALSADQRTVYKPEQIKGKSELSGGYDSIAYERLKVVYDRYAPFRELRVQNPKTIYRKLIQDVKPIDTGGSVWRQLSNLDGDGRDNDVWTMTFRTYQLVASNLCNGNGRVKNIAATM